MKSEVFERVLLEEFRKYHGIDGSESRVSLTELVILTWLKADIAQSYGPKDKWSLSATGLLDEIKTAYYPFPVPFQDSTFFEALRKMPLKKTPLVKVVGEGRPRYVLTMVGYLVLSLETVVLSRQIQADHALLIMNSAIREKSRRWDLYIPSFFQKLISGVSIDKDSRDEFFLPDFGIKEYAFKLQPNVISSLEDAGETTLSGQISRLSKFTEAAIGVVKAYGLSEIFYKTSLSQFAGHFKSQSKGFSDDNYGLLWKKTKCKHMAQICEEALKILK